MHPSYRDVGVVICNGLGTFELGIVVELFGLPRPEMPEWYTFKVCGAEEGALGATGGLQVTPQEGLEGLETAGTIILPGWRGATRGPPGALPRAPARADEPGAPRVPRSSGGCG